ncbi:zinc finger Ran-binding domain-containing protein 2-like [Oryza brachyantha]|uniref:zinc finger Ran-binding domain-containing protein 2-like n=1 Tax=Oryza brachyantha TaxID=4533 RepID=UPI001ADB6ACF|nr:zinc finger Ran-binding domain-containing protein 2-like [Oryza brachyantha]
MTSSAAEGKEKGACELCGAAARVYCGADEATLCWGCDAQVHGANFLVARHARALLCRGCARPTPWRAAGPRLGPTASLCDRCVRRGGGGGGRGGGGGGGDEVMGGGDGDGVDGEEVVVEGEEEDEDEDDDEEEEGEGENQVVPWAEEAEATPPPVASSTSSSSREAAANGANAADHAKEDQPCSTSQPSLRRYASSARHGGRSDEATSSRNGTGGRFLAPRHRKRSPSDFRRSGSAQSGSGTQGRNCSNAAIGRNDFS